MSNLPPNWQANHPNGARNFSMGTTCFRDNAIANYTGSTARNRWKAMPQKFSPSAGDSMFSRNRLAYSRACDGNTYDIDAILAGETAAVQQRNAGKPLQFMDSSQRTSIRSQKAVGKSSIPATTTESLSFTNTNRSINNVINRAQRRARSGGAVAPPKKAANTSFKSGGGCC